MKARTTIQVLSLLVLLTLGLAGAFSIYDNSAAAGTYGNIWIDSSVYSGDQVRYVTVDWHLHAPGSGSDVSSAGAVYYGTAPDTLTSRITTGCYDITSGTVAAPCDAIMIMHREYTPNLLAGRTYYYKVVSLDGQFTESPVLSLNTPMFDSGVIRMYGPSVSSLGDTSANVGWSAGLYPVGHAVTSSGAVEISTSSTGPFTEVTTGCTPDPCSAWGLLHNVSLTGLTPGTTYYWRVKSLDGQFTYSNISSFTTLGSPPPVPQAASLTPGMTNARWATFADYLARELTLDFGIANVGGSPAMNIAVAGCVNTNGVTLLHSTPFAVGSLAGSSSYGTWLRYQVPVGVSYFRTQIYVTYEDTNGNPFSLPGPFPGP